MRRHFWKRGIFTWQRLWRSATALSPHWTAAEIFALPAANTNAEASCDLVVNLFTVSTKTCQGERSRFSIVALLDVAQIACTINVHKASVMRSLWTPEGWSAADCVVRKRGASHVVTVMLPLRVIRLSLRCKMSFKYIHVFLPAPLGGWWSRRMSS